MKYAVEMGSGAMIYIPSFTDGEDIQTHRQHGDLIRILLFLQNEEFMLKKYHFLSWD
jgi:hypothetical protein